MQASLSVIRLRDLGQGVGRGVGDTLAGEDIFSSAKQKNKLPFPNPAWTDSLLEY